MQVVLKNKSSQRKESSKNDGTMVQLLATATRSCCARSRCRPIKGVVNRRHHSSGALGGGYSKENLAYYAASHWAAQEQDQQSKRKRRRRIQDDVEEDELPYADMFHQQISSDANEWLKSHPSPSVVLARSFFSSAAFVPERFILNLATSAPTKALSDASFNVGESHLVWSVAAKSPLEMILTWELESMGLAKGATQLAFDPSLRRLYQGNALKQVPDWAVPLLPLHERYAKYLLQGMVDVVENAAQKSVASNNE